MWRGQPSRVGNPCLQLRDVLGSIYTDEDFADLFPRRGQSAETPWRLALVTVLQFAEGLSDRQAAEAVRSRIDWKYALGLVLADPGFDFSVLSEFRARLIAGGAEQRLLNHLLEQCQARGFVKARGRQRTDSTRVPGALRQLNRLESVGETMRQALNAIAAVAPEWLRALAPAEWFDRYARRIEDARLPTNPEEEFGKSLSAVAAGRRPPMPECQHVEFGGISGPTETVSEPMDSSHGLPDADMRGLSRHQVAGSRCSATA